MNIFKRIFKAIFDNKAEEEPVEDVTVNKTPNASAIHDIFKDIIDKTDKVIMDRNTPEVRIDKKTLDTIYEQGRQAGIKEVETGVVVSGPLSKQPEEPKINTVETTLTLHRKSQRGKATLGELYCAEGLLCYTLEDVHRDNKVYAETRIPAGRYKLGFRTVGGFYAKYRRKYTGIGQDRGMIQILNVPEFEYILIHIGNTHVDTAGCILVGEEPSTNQNNWALYNSRVAYYHVYEYIANLLETCDAVYIEILDEE